MANKTANITAADSLKVTELVKTTLAATIAENKTVCFVYLASFFGAGKFSHMRKHNFVEEVSDELTSTELNKQFGSWVFTEYGDGYYVFVKLVDTLKDGFILYPTNRTKFESLSHLQFANEVEGE